MYHWTVLLDRLESNLICISKEVRDAVQDGAEPLKVDQVPGRGEGPRFAAVAAAIGGHDCEILEFIYPRRSDVKRRLGMGSEGEVADRRMDYEMGGGAGGVNRAEYGR